MATCDNDQPERWGRPPTTATRIREIRLLLHLSQSEFARIFTSQRREGKVLEARAVSHWENGKSVPTARQLEELLDFLEDPTQWLELEGRVTNPWTALRYLLWYDEEHPAISYDDESRPIVPATIKGRRESLKPLVDGILDHREDPDSWQRRLARCAYLASPNPFKEVRIARLAAQKGESFVLAENEKVLAQDIRMHGAGVTFLFESSFCRLRDDDRNRFRSMSITYGEIFSNIRVDGRTTIPEWIAGCSKEEAIAFNLGVFAMAANLGLICAGSLSLVSIGDDGAAPPLEEQIAKFLSLAYEKAVRNVELLDLSTEERACLNQARALRTKEVEHWRCRFAESDSRDPLFKSLARCMARETIAATTRARNEDTPHG